jgi:hypothetical protein
MGWAYKSDGEASRVMLGTPPAAWSLASWCLVVLGTLYAVGLLVFWFRFQAAERSAQRGDPAAARRFNALLRGFPNAVYAKMLGKKPYEEPADRAQP